MLSKLKKKNVESMDRNLCIPLNKLGTMVAQWLKCCATNQKDTVLIQDGVIGIFR